LRIVGWSFIALAAYIVYECGSTLVRHEAPERSIPGIIIAAASVVVMPLLARAKRRVAAGIGSGAMHADSRQTDFCTYLIVDDVETLVRAAIDGIGLAFVSDERVSPQLASGELIRVLEDWWQPFPGFFLYYPSRRQQPAALAALIKILRL
jgi:DNA-binding transcriptional LysR family regulator